MKTIYTPEQLLAAKTAAIWVTQDVEGDGQCIILIQRSEKPSAIESYFDVIAIVRNVEEYSRFDEQRGLSYQDAVDACAKLMFDERDF